MLFECDRCGYSTNKKSDFIRHLSRKEPCIAIEHNIPIIEIKKKYQIIEPTETQDAKTYPFECLFCNRRYKYKYNKTKHVKTCSVRKEAEIIQDIIQEPDTATSISMLSEILNTLSVMNKKIDCIAKRCLKKKKDKPLT